MKSNHLLLLFFRPKYADIVISTDREHPSWAAHQITLSVANLAPLVLQVPWPFLTEQIEVSLHKKNKKKPKKFIRLILKKSLNDPFPSDFGGRSKWDLNLLKPWREIDGHGTLKRHVEAQFHCDYFIMDKFSFKSSTPSPLDEVREIFRAIIYGNFFNSLYLFAVHHLDEPVFYLKIQPIVRFSPHGAPLLITSVNEYQLAQQLMAKGALDSEQYQADFHRIFTEGVSRKVCIIRASSVEEVDLLRYAFRVNSTKMRRSVWQSMNLPRGENSPWLATFISPLYSRRSLLHCRSVSKNICYLSRCDKITIDVLPFLKVSFSKFSPLTQCASCCVKKIELLKCSRCMSVSYCSTACQKQNWGTHKFVCTAA